MSSADNVRAVEEVDGVKPGIISLRICAIMLVLYALYFARSLVVPVATGIVFYLVLRPVVRYGGKMGVPSSVSAVGIMLGLFVTLSVGMYLVIEPAKQTIVEAPRYLDTVKTKLSFITARLREVDDATDSIAKAADGEDPQESDETPVRVEIKQAAWAGNLSYLSGTGSVVTFLTISGVLLYFLLAHGDDLLRRIMSSLPDFTSRRRLMEVIQHVQEGLGSYLAQVSTINLALGAAVGAAMWMFGMPSPVLWGVMAFAFNFIPIVGAIAGAAIIFVVALVSFEPTYYAFVVTLTYLTLTTVEGQFITPSILGRSMSMNPIMVFLAVSIWGWMWGLMGVFLAVPLLIATRMACESYEGLAPLGLILGTDSAVEETRSREQTHVSEADSG